MLKYEANTKLAQMLNDKNISQADLHRLIAKQNEKPITKYLINNLVNGKRTNMNTDTLLKICRALQCTPNDILDKEVINNNHPIQE